MHKGQNRAITVALWVIAANLTFLSASSLNAPAHAEMQAGNARLDHAINCDDNNICWVRVLQPRAGGGWPGD